MKFVLKVLVLVCLVIVSKLVKEDALALQKPVTQKSDSEAVFTSHTSAATPQLPLAETRRPEVSIKFVKGALQVN